MNPASIQSGEKASPPTSPRSRHSCPASHETAPAQKKSQISRSPSRVRSAARAVPKIAASAAAVQAKSKGALRGGVGKDLLADEHRDRADHGDGVCTDGPARGEVANEVQHVMDARPRPIPFGRPRTYRSAPSRGTRTGEIGPLSPDRVTTSEWASVSAGDPTARPHDLRRARLPRRGD